MPNTQLTPNELADLYDCLFTLLEGLPTDSHPGWAFAIETVIGYGAGNTCAKAVFTGYAD